MNTNRRDFIKTSTYSRARTYLSFLPDIAFSKDAAAKVRLGFIGVGFRGQSHLELALKRSDVEVVALCDIQQSMMDMSLQLVSKANKPKPAVILDGPWAYRKLLENKDIDAVIISTPWEWHSIMCLDSMNAKKYVGCEVNVGMTVEECWELVHTSERTGMPH
jgi:predicted dehydrogenase